MVESVHFWDVGGPGVANFCIAIHKAINTTFRRWFLDAKIFKFMSLVLKFFLYIKHQFSSKDRRRLKHIESQTQEMVE